MRTSVTWSERARRDLHSTLLYLLGRSPQAARRLAAAILKRAQRLAAFPESGRRVPEFPHGEPPLREIIVEGYRLVYVVREHRVDILTLFHGRRQFPNVRPTLH